MIVNERDDQFLMINQHEHAMVSGELALQWKRKFLIRSKLREEADWAVSQHDRAWIPLDEHPIWNEASNRPYSFIDYPLKEKLSAYQRGVKEVSDRSIYAAILCSKHYQSFFSKDSEDPLVIQFIMEEEKRRENLRTMMKICVPSDIFQVHFDRLQFCDNLSLYVCMQEPGISKEQEVPWFRNGFRQQFDEAPEGVMPRWIDGSHVSLDPFPFEQPLEVRIPYRLVKRDSIEEKGLEVAYKEAEIHERCVVFIPHSF
ncbi:DUF3891 family protein [Halobacillus seohaensis]|uniref:DUF3891 family protein n=1 Tax=Halobacillus seohaensis TaxID=447421 RepID=A0ABW2EKW7_9BACI